jgi:S-adenosyl-L-methionine hydrolase (adenosine-forming)
MADSREPSRPVVAFLTDFGTRDHYVGAMKGALLGVCPDATLVDLTHEVPPQDVLGGALELAAAYRFFPEGTIFVAVVDPGVGSRRRAIAAEAGAYRFVAPDNGVLTVVLREATPVRVVELSNPRYARDTVSRTFEGRDRFAPAAGWLARGVPLAAFGGEVSDYLLLDIPVVEVRDNRVEGVVLRVDRFGNLITNIDRAAFERASRGKHTVLTVAGATIAGVVSTYAEAPEGELCALFGSSGHLEIAVRNGSAAALLAVGRCAPVVVSGS